MTLIYHSLARASLAFGFMLLGGCAAAAFLARGRAGRAAASLECPDH